MIGSPSFSWQSAHTSLLLIILSWIKLDGYLYSPGLRQTTHQLTCPACQQLLLTLTPQCQHHLIRMQEGDAPINVGKCHMRRFISGGKKTPVLPGSGQRRWVCRARLQWSPPSPFCLRLKPSLANMSSDSQLGARVTLTLSLFFITGLAVERLPTQSLSQILLELLLSHGTFIPSTSAAILASAVRSCLNFLLPR